MVQNSTDQATAEQATSSQTRKKDSSSAHTEALSPPLDTAVQAIRLKQASGNAQQFLPLTITPNDSHKFTLQSFCDWLVNHSLTIKQYAMQHGAVLFRGFPIAQAADFDRVRQSLPMIPMPYFGGAAVRKLIYGEHIFTTNESPPSEPIPYHHELSQTPEPPDYICFYCETPSRSGGETPLLDSRAMYRFIAEKFPRFTQDLEALGVKYVRILPERDDPSSAIGRSWQSTWQTQNREEAEQRMREQGMQWEWLAGGELKTITRALPALRTDPRDGTPVFFNSMIAAYKGWVDSRNTPEKSVLLGNNSPLPAEILEAIFEFMGAQAVAIPWQKGDVIFIDNWITMHARNPFSGARRILAAIGRATPAAL